MMVAYASTDLRTTRFRAKIRYDNHASVALFRSLGFAEVSRSDIFREATLEWNVAGDGDAKDDASRAREAMRETWASVTEDVRLATHRLREYLCRARARSDADADAALPSPRRSRVPSPFWERASRTSGGCDPSSTSRDHGAAPASFSDVARARGASPRDTTRCRCRPRRCRGARRRRGARHPSARRPRFEPDRRSPPDWSRPASRAESSAPPRARRRRRSRRARRRALAGADDPAPDLDLGRRRARARVLGRAALRAARAAGRAAKRRRRALGRAAVPARVPVAVSPPRRASFVEDGRPASSRTSPAAKLGRPRRVGDGLGGYAQSLQLGDRDERFSRRGSGPTGGCTPTPADACRHARSVHGCGRRTRRWNSRGCRPRARSRPRAVIVARRELRSGAGRAPRLRARLALRADVERWVFKTGTRTRGAPSRASTDRRAASTNARRATSRGSSVSRGDDLTAHASGGKQEFRAMATRQRRARPPPSGPPAPR